MTTMLRCAKLYEPARRTSSILTRTGATSSSAKCPHSVLHSLKFSSPSSRSVFLESGLYSSRSFVRYFGKQPWRVQNRRGNWGSDSPLFDGNNVLYAIMGLNVITTGAWYMSERNYQLKKFMRENFMVSSNGVLRHFRVHTLVTAIFTNYDISHLISNLFSIYIAFTPGGGARFAAMYLAGGLLSTGTQVIMVNREYESISGANCAAGTVFFYKALRDPRMTILLFGVLPATLGSIAFGLLAIEVASAFIGRGYGDQSRLGGAALALSIHVSNV